MSHDQYTEIYESLNWDAPNGPVRCSGCADLGAPIAGAYPSSLVHYEAVLGPLGETRTRARVLVLLQDPRPGEGNFTTADPRASVSRLGPDEHRYFCLTPVAWRTLKLDRATGSPTPHWPSEETAPHFLRRYLSRAGAWSYDGFLAYFLYLLRPEDALVTDLAKCHFGERQQAAVFDRCAALHLRRECAELQPNLVVSFTSRLTDGRFFDQRTPALARLPRLNLFHPASRESADSRRDRFSHELERCSADLAQLGIDAAELVTRWAAHVTSARTAR